MKGQTNEEVKRPVTRHACLLAAWCMLCVRCGVSWHRSMSRTETQTTDGRTDESLLVPKCISVRWTLRHQCRNVLVPKCPSAEMSVKHSTLFENGRKVLRCPPPDSEHSTFSDMACARVARGVACFVEARLRMCDTCRYAESAARHTPVGSECCSPADLRCQSTSSCHATPPQSPLAEGAWADCV